MYIKHRIGIFLYLDPIGAIKERKEVMEDKDTRYFIEIEIDTLEVIRVGFDDKINLEKGLQTDSDIHRVFVSKGQYQKLVSRCENELQSVLDT